MPNPLEISVRTDDGTAPCEVHRPDDARVLPGVILYPDAGSIRPVIRELATRIAARGYVVLVPHIFYRHDPYAPFDPMTVFGDPAERDRLMTMVRSLDLASAMRDAAHYLRALHAQPGVSPGPVGCFGYCIGGRLTFATAGAFPDAVGAAACIHGGALVTDAPDSPHLNAPKLRAELYFAVADNDPSCTPEQQGKLAAALGAAHARYTLEHFTGAAHGFAMPDFPVYAKDAADLSWTRIEALFARALGAPTRP